MISATLDLETFLNGTKTGVSIPVFTFTMAGGVVVRFARWDADVTFDGVTWLAQGKPATGWDQTPLMRSYRIRVPLGLEESAQCELRLEGGAVTGGELISYTAAMDGFRDGRLLIERLYATTPGRANASVFVGKLFRFYGQITNAATDTTGTTLTVESLTALLRSVQLPRTLVTASCSNALYDAACGLLRASYTTDWTTTAGCTTSVLYLTGAAWTAGEWEQGSVFVHGMPNDNGRRGIRSSSATSLTLATPLPSAPGSGVTVHLTRGCDHSLGPKGCQFFGNEARFRAEPFLPREG